MLVVLTGCISLNSSEKATLTELESYGISSTEHKIKQPGVAGILNILPGFGNFYLASGTDEGQQWLFGFLNLLLWPVSVVWAIPEGAIDANTMNKQETIRYYTFDANGKKELERIKAESD